MNKTQQLLWGTGSLKERLFRVAILSPGFTIGYTLLFLYHSTHNEFIFWSGVMTLMMTYPLGGVVALLMLSLTKRRKNKRREQQASKVAGNPILETGLDRVDE